MCNGIIVTLKVGNCTMLQKINRYVNQFNSKEQGRRKNKRYTDRCFSLFFNSVSVAVAVYYIAVLKLLKNYWLNWHRKSVDKNT